MSALPLASKLPFSSHAVVTIERAVCRVNRDDRLDLLVYEEKAKVFFFFSFRFNGDIKEKTDRDSCMTFLSNFKPQRAVIFLKKEVIRQLVCFLAFRRKYRTTR